MTLTAYVAQLLGLYLALSGFLMLVREQAMMVLAPKFIDSPPSLNLIGSLRSSSASRSCLRTPCGSERWGRSYTWSAGSRFCAGSPCSCFPSKRNGRFRGLLARQCLVRRRNGRHRARRLARRCGLHGLRHCPAGSDLRVRLTPKFVAPHALAFRSAIAAASTSRRFPDGTLPLGTNGNPAAGSPTATLLQTHAQFLTLP